MTKISEVELNPQHLMWMTTGLDKGQRLVRCSNPKSLESWHDAISKYLGNTGEIDKDEAAIVAVYWGWGFVTHLDWEWIGVSAGDWNGLAIADKERRYVVLPVDYFMKLVGDARNDDLATPQEVFEGIANGVLPAYPPRSYVVVS